MSSLESEVKRLREENRGIDGLKEINKTLNYDKTGALNNYEFYRKMSYNYQIGLGKVKNVLEGKATILNSRSKIGSLINLIKETEKEVKVLQKNRKK